MATQVGSGDELIIYLPNRGQTNWSEDFRTQFAELIAKHDHTGAGKGVKITGSAIAEGTIQDSNLAFVDLTPTPQTGYVLQWNGSNFVPGAVSADGGISGISAQADSTIMALTDTAVTLTTNSGSPANTPGNELDLRINGGKVLVDGSNNSNLLLSSSVGASAADPNTKLYIKLAARSTAFDATDKTTWSDIVISNPTDSGNAAVGMRFTVDDADDTNEGAGIAGVKTSATEPDMDLRFITHPTASSTSRESMKLSDSFDGNSLGHTTTLTVNDDSQTSNITRLGLGTDTPTVSIDVSTSQNATIRLNSTDRTGNANNSKITFEEAGSTKGTLGFRSSADENLYIQTEAANAGIKIDSHDIFEVTADGTIDVSSGGDINIEAGDHTSNDSAHILLKAGQPSGNPGPGDGDIFLVASDDVVISSDDATIIRTGTSNTDQLLIRADGDLEYKGDFGSATNAYFARVYGSIGFHKINGWIYEWQADGVDSYTLGTFATAGTQPYTSGSGDYIQVNFITSFPAGSPSYKLGGNTQMGATNSASYWRDLSNGCPYACVIGTTAPYINSSGNPAPPNGWNANAAEQDAFVVVAAKTTTYVRFAAHSGSTALYWYSGFNNFDFAIIRR